ncbi:histidine--tRNA ligase [uncultured Zobellia sp.]|uniref:histidine--tRNA ligase n=1 Tax=uncultured Zobellia sp. TaxID=255433 RepID=UPI0025969438|nr:histidine--tRNA ligase [uncultured Zobellia sp.]
MAQKPSIPKGTRDFTPSEVIKRNYIFDIVKRHFQTFGFQPIETPSFENSDTLMGKYGDEGDRLIFKILNSGDYLDKYFSTINKIILGYMQRMQKSIKGVLLSNDSKVHIQDSKQISEWVISQLNDAYNGIEEKPFSVYNKKFFDYLSDLIGDSTEDLNSFTEYSSEELQKFSDKAANQLFVLINTGDFSSHISEKALRYDLTVPFARYVVMHQNEIDFPFKRYQIQPVWRADRPQKGRFREFFQCDADVVGSDSLLQEIEFVQLYDAVFTDLKLEGVNIKMNNRKILSGIAEVIGAQDLLIDFTVALDKLDKIGEEGVKKEMAERGLTPEAIAKVEPLFSLTGSNLEQLQALRDLLKDSETGSKGVEELTFIVSTIEEMGLQSAKLSIDVTLARGLNYYTGAIFEVGAPEGVKMGSIGGGGRYDDLTGIFGLKDVSGVGISFGLDRIYLVLEELGLFPERIDQSLQVLCLNFGDKEGLAALKLVSALRKNGVKADVYPSNAKIQKQFKYANNRNVPYVVLIGEKELEENFFVVKHMESGEQKTYALNAISDFITTL